MGETYRCPKGVSVKIASLGDMDFSALHYMDEDFDPGNTRKMRHTKDLYERKETYVITGNVMRGLGGDNSWGEYPHKEYRHYSGNISSHTYCLWKSKCFV